MARFGGTYTGTRGTTHGSSGTGFANTLSSQLGVDHTLDSVEIDIQDNGTNDDFRIGVYYGPAASATLVWESGQQNGAGLDGIVTITAGGQTLPAGQDIHLVIVTQAINKFRHPSDGSEDGDWDGTLRVFDDIGAATTAFPATNTSVSSSGTLDPLRMWINATSTGGGEVTKTPTQAVLDLSGRTPSANPFNHVRIRDVLINGSGQPVANATDIRLMVWYSGQCIGDPDLSMNGQTTGANGSASWSFASGALTFGQAIFYVAQNSVSFSTYTCARMVPDYSLG